MTGDFDMADIRRMVLRADVVVLQNAGRVEVVHEGPQVPVVVVCRRPRAVGRRVVDDGVSEVTWGVEILVYGVDLGLESRALLVCVPHGAEAFPEGEADHLRFGVARVHLVD